MVQTERTGLTSEDDVMALVKKLRNEDKFLSDVLLTGIRSAPSLLGVMIVCCATAFFFCRRPAGNIHIDLDHIVASQCFYQITFQNFLATQVICQCDKAKKRRDKKQDGNNGSHC